MKVRQTILDKINTPTVRNRIGTALSIGEQAVAVQIRRNATNGRLTKMDALKAISEETGVAIEEILEEEKEVA